MNKGFNFEKGLSHQTQAVNSTISVFENIEIKQGNVINKNFVNPEFDIKNSVQYANNILTTQRINGISEEIKGASNTIDIMMETGTGKTYTYAKTIFELNKNFGVFKFIIIVPTLSIKAGTVSFLKSDSAREHFKEECGYGKTIKLHIVESKKNNKDKYFPLAVSEFVNAGIFDKKSIQVMIINTGMINSKTMEKSFDQELFDKYTTPFEAIGAVNPFLIIDEPHKFKSENTTWTNIQKMTPQFILRYGATFHEYQNLIYTLNAVESFTRNLVKGVVAHITEFEDGKNAIVRLTNIINNEAVFELNENQNQKKIIKLIAKESLEKVHPQMNDLYVDAISGKINKKIVKLSNGLELKRGDKINPYSFCETLQETMIKKAIKNHFEIEKKFLTREVKIKPLTLFFIDNIEDYRNKENGRLNKLVEEIALSEIESLLKKEKNNFYKSYLEKTKQKISDIHGGYFSEDNSVKGEDKDIEEQLNKILHDKQKLLGLDDLTRFIFSKWTLREGWDNPNVFQICKLRSSGSEISKLQEVGRGLRLPVNEFMNRVKDEQFDLNYFVDFTEADFADKLINEINKNSGAISIEDIQEKLTGQMINQICEKYNIAKDELLKKLDEENVINRSNDFKENGFEYIKKNYPLIFGGVGTNQIRKATTKKRKVQIRTGKYAELKELWETINQKVILEYKFEDERDFKKLFTGFLKEYENKFNESGLKERISKIKIENKQAVVVEGISSDNKLRQISTMKYSDFLLALVKELSINIKTLHQSFIESKIDINKYLNVSTIRFIKHNFNNYLMYNAIDKFGIEYKKITNKIHPTKLTNASGEVLSEVDISSNIGVFHSESMTPENYLFKELYYDSELEKENIQKRIDGVAVTVFTKIPKNSIKIPVAGGKSYSPDFAYVLNFKNGDKKLFFIVETKNVNSEDNLRKEENQKIKFAEKFFGKQIKIKFETQFSNDKIVDLINKVMKEKG